MDVLLEITLRLVRQPLKQRAVHVAIEHSRMDVAAAANRRRVAEMRGDLLDGVDDRLLALGVAVEILELAQGLGGEVGGGPGAEVLGGDVLAGDLAQVVVDVIGVDRAPLVPNGETRLRFAGSKVRRRGFPQRVR